MNNLQVHIAEAAQRLAKGQLVAFPTETVYGLGADASNPQAVAAIFHTKGRPLNHPVIVHVAPNANLLQWVSHVPAEAQRLIDAFWPGPLTLILPKAQDASPALTGGQDTIGVRCPSHPVAQAMLTAFTQLKEGAPAGVAAPSANRFGQVSPTQAQHVRDEFPDKQAAELYVLEGGAATVGIESTIVDVSRLDQGQPPVILRPGHIRAEDIAAVLGYDIESAVATSANKPRVSGSLKAHYAPRTPLYLVSVAQMKQLADTQAVVVSWSDELPSAGHVYKAPKNAAAFASRLYGMLRELDTQGYSAIYVQQPPTTTEWEAVNDRLGRAAAAFETEN